MSREWVVAVVSPHFAAAVAARDLDGSASESFGADPFDLDADPGGDLGGWSTDDPARTGRRMQYVLSYDREQVIAAASLLMSRVQPPVSSSPGRRDKAVSAARTELRLATATGGVDNAEPGTSGAGTGMVGLRPVVLAGVPAEQLPTLLTRAIATASNGIVIVDATAQDMLLVYVNAVFEQLTGYTAEQVLGRNCRLLQGPGTDPLQVRVIARRLLTGRSVWATLLNYRRDGSAFWSEVTINPVHDAAGRLTHFIGNQVDVSERVEREERTTHLAYHDVLTGLPNRAHVLDSLDLELRRSDRSESGVAVVFIDLKGFKAINDAFGHAAGDQALIHAARQLRSVLRSGDLLARLAGDEFLLVLTGLPSDDDEPVRRVVQHLHDALDTPLEVPGATLTLRASIGLAPAPRAGANAADLIDVADAYMYRAKRAT